MATRYWVGGTGTWDGTTTTHWAASTGGTSGASAPTLTDDVVFDGNSGLTTNQVVTILNTATCGGCVISGIAGRAVKFQLGSGVPTTWGTGTYSFQGLDDATPVLIVTSTTGIQRSLVINGTHGTHSNVSFQDVALTGTAGTLTGTRIGDMHGNSGITFDASIAQTWVGALTSGTYSWSDPANWSGHIPLAQDDVTFSGNVASGQTVNVQADVGPLCRDLDMSGISGVGAFNLNRPQVGGVNINNLVLGAFVLSSRVANGGPSPANSIFLMGRDTHNLSFGGFSLSFSMKVQAVAGTYVLIASTPVCSGGFQVGSGTVDANGFSFNIRGNFQVTADQAPLTATFLGRAANHSFGGNSINNGFILGNSGSVAASALNFASGTGAWTLPGTGTVWQFFAGANFTGIPMLLITDASATAKTFNGANGSYGIVRASPGSGGITFGFGNYQYRELTVTGAGVPVTITATVGQSRTMVVSGGILTLRGQAGQPLTVASSVPGTAVNVVVATGTYYNLDSFSLSSDVVLVLPDAGVTQNSAGRSHL